MKSIITIIAIVGLSISAQAQVAPNQHDDGTGGNYTDTVGYKMAADNNSDTKLPHRAGGVADLDRVRYCVALNGNAPILTRDGRKVNSTVGLSNGAVITTNGYVIGKDGSKTTLKSGECIDNKGHVTKMDD